MLVSHIKPYCLYLLCCKYKQNPYIISFDIGYQSFKGVEPLYPIRENLEWLMIICHTRQAIKDDIFKHIIYRDIDGRQGRWKVLSQCQNGTKIEQKVFFMVVVYLQSCSVVSTRFFPGSFCWHHEPCIFLYLFRMSCLDELRHLKMLDTSHLCLVILLLCQH